MGHEPLYPKVHVRAISRVTCDGASEVTLPEVCLCCPAVQLSTLRQLWLGQWRMLLVSIPLSKWGDVITTEDTFLQRKDSYLKVTHSLIHVSTGEACVPLSVVCWCGRSMAWIAWCTSLPWACTPSTRTRDWAPHYYGTSPHRQTGSTLPQQSASEEHDALIGLTPCRACVWMWCGVVVRGSTCTWRRLARPTRGCTRGTGSGTHIYIHTYLHRCTCPSLRYSVHSSENTSNAKMARGLRRHSGLDLRAFLVCVCLLWCCMVCVCSREVSAEWKVKPHAPTVWFMARPPSTQ